MVLEIVQYSFCKFSLELVVVVPICIFGLFVNLSSCICGAVLWALHGVIVHRDQFDILWHAILSPICRVLYIFYYVNLVLLMFCSRVAAVTVCNNMYTHLV